MRDGSAIIFLIIAAAAWGFFLLPSFFDRRRDAPLNSTQEFDRLTQRLQSVQRVAAHRSEISRQNVVSRRRRVLIALILTAVTTFGLAVWQQSFVLLAVHVVIDGVLAWYLAMLIQLRQRRTQIVVDLRDAQAAAADPDGGAAEALASN